MERSAQLLWGLGGHGSGVVAVLVVGLGVVFVLESVEGDLKRFDLSA